MSPMPPERKEKEVVAHTPTPWETFLSHGDVIIREKDGPQVALAVHGEVEVDKTIANAEFIVRAVNSFDQLLDALKRVRGACLPCDPESNIIGIVNSVIAKAEGR